MPAAAAADKGTTRSQSSSIIIATAHHRRTSVRLSQPASATADCLLLLCVVVNLADRPAGAGGHCHSTIRRCRHSYCSLAQADAWLAATSSPPPPLIQLREGKAWVVIGCQLISSPSPSASASDCRPLPVRSLPPPLTAHWPPSPSPSRSPSSSTHSATHLWPAAVLMSKPPQPMDDTKQAHVKAVTEAAHGSASALSELRRLLPHLTVLPSSALTFEIDPSSTNAGKRVLLGPSQARTAADAHAGGADGDGCG